jgi:hypothetical protein
MHDTDHYAVLEIAITTKCVVMYDGLRCELLGWIIFFVSVMKHYILVPLDAVYVTVGDDPTLITSRQGQQRKIQGYSLLFDVDEGRFERGNFIKQFDKINCGPIVCTKILEMFTLVTEYKVKLAYHTNAL